MNYKQKVKIEELKKLQKIYSTISKNKMYRIYKIKNMEKK